MLELEVQLADLKGMLSTVERRNASVDRVIETSQNRKLSLFDVAALLKYKHELLPRLIARAAEMNRILFNKEIEYYGVSYVSDMCMNACTYCGHSSSMPQQRSKLDEESMRKDFSAVLKFGPTELCILAGEHPSITPEYFVMAANIAMDCDKLDSLNRISFNIAPMSVDDFNIIRGGTTKNIQFRVFQESYDSVVYAKHHPCGPKSDFNFRLNAQQRAIEAGFDEVGIGALMGLNNNDFGNGIDYDGSGNDFEILALIAHAYNLQEKTGKLPYSLSIPRLQTVEGSCFEIPQAVDNITYLAYHAILKLALPQTKLILTRRETPMMFDALRPLINIEDLAVRPGVGGNYKQDTHFQNELGDARSTPEIISDVRAKGYTALVKGV